MFCYGSRSYNFSVLKKGIKCIDSRQIAFLTLFIKKVSFPANFLLLKNEHDK
jgi:hypothetical protein